MPKQYIKVAIHPDGRVHPQQSSLACEHCGKEVIIADSFSFACHLSLTGPELRTVVQCEEEQHFGCTLECALEAHIACLKEHTIPRFQQMLLEHQAEQVRQAEARAALQAAQAAALAAQTGEQVAQATPDPSA